MTKQLIVTLILSAYMALSINAQYFSRTYFNEDLRSRVFSVNTLNPKEQIVSSGVLRDTANVELHSISKINKDGTLTVLKDFYSKWIFIDNSVQVRNDTIFYCARDIYEIDGEFHWYFGQLDTLGKVLNEIKYKMPTPFDPFTKVYDLEFVKNNEIIIWGNGFDPNIVNERDDLSLVWIRLKLDGTLLSGPHYFKPPYDEWLLATNATTDIDGNMVFIYETTDRLTGLWKELYKIHEDDSVSKIAKVDVVDFQVDYARLAIDHDGNYIFQDINYRDGQYPYFVKIDRGGNVVWKETFEQMFSPMFGYEKIPNVSNFAVNSIKVASNNDILACGYIAIMDSIYIPNLKKKVIVSGRSGSFMARYSPDGELRWRHFLLSAKENGKARNIGIRDITEMPDGSLVVAGFLGRKDTTLIEVNDAWVMKVGPNGCFDPECSNVPDNRWWYFPEEIPTSATDLVTYEKLSLYPNPGINKINFSLPDSAIYPITYQITTISGQTVETGVQQEQHFSIDASYLSKGNYIVLCKDTSGKVWYGQWIKM